MTSRKDHNDQDHQAEDQVYVDMEGFRVATSGLDLSAIGALMTLIMQYVASRQAPLDDDLALALQVKCSLEEWLNIREQVSRFFEIRGGKWVRPSLERSLALAETQGGAVYVHFDEGRRGFAQ